MGYRVLVWGTGNVGRPAVRAVLNHAHLELAGVIVADPAKDGCDVGDLVGLAPIGLTATRDWESALTSGADAVIYTATGDTRPAEAMGDLMACLEAGLQVVSTSFYALLDPGSAPEELLQQVDTVCERTGASLLVSGIDPGWAMDMLPIALSGAVADIREIRTREIFNYALYDQPSVVREVIGFGESMDTLPMMLHDFSIELVWGPMVKLVARALGTPVDRLESTVERLPLEQDIDVPGMGLFKAGTQGAFRFELRGYHQGRALSVLEHVTRIDDSCAPDWPYPAQGRGCHQVIISGNPDLHVSLHAKDHYETGAGGGGNASAAAWLVNALPLVCDAKPGVLTVLDLPQVSGSYQLDHEADSK